MHIRKTVKVIGTPIDVLSWDEAISTLQEWGAQKLSKYICICNVHSVVTATQDAELKAVFESSDMNTSDGAPVAWMLRKLGLSQQRRINGPDLMWKFCAHAEKTGVSIFLYGATQSTLDTLKAKFLDAFPELKIAGMYSPPFRVLSAEEDQQIVDMVNQSGAGVVWVGLGCPKQEKWMAAHRNRIQAVMVGVGAAFDYHAGTIQRAPLWMQNAGLEWLHRLCSEPGRLWKRYFFTNSLFIFFAVKQLMCKKAS